MNKKHLHIRLNVIQYGVYFLILAVCGGGVLIGLNNSKTIMYNIGCFLFRKFKQFNYIFRVDIKVLINIHKLYLIYQ